MTEEEPEETVARFKTTVVYPRFLGMDDGGSLVWELENGRWTWGEDPWEALGRTRTFEPERYVVKYGAPRAIKLKEDGEL